MTMHWAGDSKQICAPARDAATPDCSTWSRTSWLHGCCRQVLRITHCGGCIASIMCVVLPCASPLVFKQQDLLPFVPLIVPACLPDILLMTLFVAIRVPIENIINYYGDDAVFYDTVEKVYGSLGKVPYGLCTASYVCNGTHTFAFGVEPGHGWNSNTESVIQMASITLVS